MRLGGVYKYPLSLSIPSLLHTHAGYEAVYY